MKLKDLQIKVKAGPDDGLGEGEFTAYAAVFGNRDSYGDVIVPGAFAKTLADWQSGGNFIPLLFGHNMSDPDFNIGHVITAEEDDHGLKVSAQLDLENPKAMQVYRMLKGKRINQMSFAYDVIEGAESEHDGTWSYELRELKLYEVSVVTIGANQETEILSVKSGVDALTASVKAGRVLAQKHIDSLRQAQEAIGTVITAAEAVDEPIKAADHDDQSKASDTAEASPVASDEPAQGKSSAASEQPKSAPSPVECLAETLRTHAHHEQEGA